MMGLISEIFSSIYQSAQVSFYALLTIAISIAGLTALLAGGHFLNSQLQPPTIAGTEPPPADGSGDLAVWLLAPSLLIEIFREVCGEKSGWGPRRCLLMLVRVMLDAVFTVGVAGVVAMFWPKPGVVGEVVSEKDAEGEVKQEEAKQE